MLIDANLLLFAVDEASPHHERVRGWLVEQLSGHRPVGMPWESLTAFLTIVTNPRIYRDPLDSDQAWDCVSEWLSAPGVWIPLPTERHADVLGLLMTRYGATGNLIPDAHMAALALEHGLVVCSADGDFARFSEIRLLNPLTEPGGFGVVPADL